MENNLGRIPGIVPLCILLLSLSACSSRGASDPSPSEVHQAGQDAAVSGTDSDPLELRIAGSDVAFTLIHMPGGTFDLGGGAAVSEQPAVPVRVSPFWISETEVTYDAFALFRFAERDSDSTNVAGKMLAVDAVARPSTPYEDPSHGMDGPGFPAVGVTQWSALQYARWLSEKTGMFFRLPTEAEWEFACLAGAGAGASVGSASGTTAWHAGNSDDRLHIAGETDADLAGLRDMLGNVAEWTLDQYDDAYYSNLASAEPGSVVDPWREPTRLHPRTVRGGSYESPEEELSCKAREESSMRWKRRDPQIPKSFWWNTDSPFVGFRLVAPVNPPTESEQAAFWATVLGG